ncbi:MAG: hypothetical protein A3K83_00855 [Omnitrophica WOR_2 bacterium RBG_13_44_8b]|nr:MAG: hypothetical protein A3K83_00855 [Omnitrophica WOR_2 bacterium RBG_13_44_8b]
MHVDYLPGCLYTVKILIEKFSRSIPEPIGPPDSRKLSLIISCIYSGGGAIKKLRALARGVFILTKCYKIICFDKFPERNCDNILNVKGLKRRNMKNFSFSNKNILLKRNNGLRTRN